VRMQLTDAHPAGGGGSVVEHLFGDQLIVEDQVGPGQALDRPQGQQSRMTRTGPDQGDRMDHRAGRMVAGGHGKTLEASTFPCAGSGADAQTLWEKSFPQHSTYHFRACLSSGATPASCSGRNDCSEVAEKKARQEKRKGVFSSRRPLLL